MARKQNPFAVADHEHAQAVKRFRASNKEQGRYITDPNRPDELKQRDEQGAHYKRRKDRVNNPFRTIVF